MTWTRIKSFMLIFGVQFIQYCIVSISYRAMAQGRYVWTFVTDMIYGLNSFYLIKRIMKSDSNLEIIGYTLGGACGSMLAIWITKQVFGS